MSDLFIRIKRSLSNNKKNSKRVLNNSNDSNSNSSKDSPRNNKHLICDDSYSNRIILKKYLEMCNCKVEEVEHIDDIIDNIKKNGEYIIIWINSNMPDMAGIDCTKYLREKLNYNGKIIALTGYIDETTRKECINAGINEIVCKPFNKHEIEVCAIKYS